MLQRPFSAAVRVNASFWLLVLLATIVSPLAVVAAILTAATLHELGHLAVMRYYGVSVKRFRLTALGAVGATGNATGAHLHFELLSGSKYLDPIAYAAKTV